MADQAQSLRELMKQLRAQESKEQRDSGARVIAITSGKGGVGKSNITFNLGLALARTGKRVVLFDADLGLANLDVLMGLNPHQTLEHVLHGGKELRDIMLEGPGGVWLIPGGSGIRDLAHIQEADRENLLHGLIEVGAGADFLLIDTGAGISPNVLSFVLAADDVIIVTTAEPTALLDAYSMIKIIGQDRDAGEANLHLLINMVQDRSEGQFVGEKIQAVAGKHTGLPVNLMGSIVRDPNLQKAVRRQKPFFLDYPTSPAAQGFRQVAYRVIEQGSQSRRRLSPQRFFKRVIRLFSS